MLWSIPVGSHEVDVEADSWLDRTLADLNKDELKAVALADISLSKKEEAKEKGKEKVWLLDGATKEEIEKEAVDKLLNKVTAISVQSVLDPATSAELFTKDPAVQFTVTKQDDSTVTYAFAKNDEDDYFILKMSDNELYFKVGKWLVEDLTEAKREKLLVGYEEKKEETPAVQPEAQEAAEQAVLPEFPPEEEEALPVQEEDLKDEPVDSADSVQNAGPAEQAQVEVKPVVEGETSSVLQELDTDPTQSSEASAEAVNEEGEKVPEL
ncbi:MAG: hypothetical protein D3922_07935 [Candidatus Electrothrix sp. AR1]|nr:hypothetical protein [Candidatus Electrothrix sp. AR1]